MIIVRVELHSAVTGIVTELARMHIKNIGGTDKHGDYLAEVMRGRSKESLDKESVGKIAELRRYPRRRLHVWNLVARALNKMEYK